MSVQMSFFDHSESVEKEKRYPIFLDECDNPIKNKIFSEIIDKYHSYKKYNPGPTRRIHFLVYEEVSGNLIGAIGISSATIAIKCRDDYIGWNKDQRLKNLGMLANNSRCCFVRDNITIKNVGSMALKQLSIVGTKRWEEKYSQSLILLETFVQPERDISLDGNPKRNGAIYRASNWIEIGITSGNSIRKGPCALWIKEIGKRGELARKDMKAALEKYGYGGKEYTITKSLPKIMFVKPLVKDWKEILNF